MRAVAIALLVSLAAASAYGQTPASPMTATPAQPRKLHPVVTPPPPAAPTPAPAAPTAQQTVPAPAATPDQVVNQTVPAANAAPPPFPSTGYTAYTFKQLGVPQGLKLVAGSAQGGVTYMVRRDQVITAARLRLMLKNSAGFPANTKLDVTVNGDSVGTIDVGSAGHAATPVDLPIDPILLTDYNRIGFKLLGVPLASCRINESGPWLSVGPRSAMDVTADHLPLANDLSILPLPFFDAHDPHKVNTSFVFARTPSTTTLEAAGIVASWLGGLAGYRGVDLPATFGSIPKGNAIVFVTGKQSLPGLNLPQVTGPTVAMMANPTDPAGKLLVVMGHDAGDLKVAARGLAFGHGAIKNGAVSAVKAIGVPDRAPYDAPGWVPDTHPVKFSELTKASNLETHGIRPEPINIDFRSAPDYFNWVDSQIPMKLRFSVSPAQMVDLQKSRIDVNLNGTPFKSVPLAEGGTIFDHIRTIHQGTVEIPPFLLTGRNRLSFYFDMTPSPQCSAIGASTVTERIDPDSTIDLSQSPHYAPMPNLSFFANSGFPFTRHAGLSETAVVMPNQIVPDDVEAYLDTMALFGEATSYPVVHVAVVHASDVNSVSRRNLLLIGSFTGQPLLGAWTSHTGLATTGGQLHAISRSAWDRIQLLFDWRNRRNDVSDVNNWVQASSGSEGALIGFRSPLDDQRSVVAISGSNPAQVAKMAGTLQSSGHVAKIQNDLVLQRGDDIASFRMARRYDVGTLARWTWLRWNLSDQPIVIVILLFAACAALAAVAFVILGIKARRRLQGANR